MPLPATTELRRGIGLLGKLVLFPRKYHILSQSGSCTPHL